MYEQFVRNLIDRGGIILPIPPGHHTEILRFQTTYGIGIVRRSRMGGEPIWDKAAEAAREHLSMTGNGSLAPQRRGRSGLSMHREGENLQIVLRDGSDCFFCLQPLGEDMTQEHLVPRSRGGPDHLSNKFLAHGKCNHKAGNLSAPEKIRIREQNMARRILSELKSGEFAGRLVDDFGDLVGHHKLVKERRS